MEWGDVLRTDHTPEHDAGVDALLSMAPADHPAREMFEPLLRGLFSQIRAQIGEENYVKFCNDLQAAALEYAQGNKEPARMMLAAYGLDITMMEQTAGITN